MHIPDGFLDGKTAVVTSALAVAGVGLALRQVRRELPARRVPLLGLGAAFLFAAQMLNFPVAGGTSGHLIGGVLMAALLGPAAAVVVVATVLIVQCFLFADGGLTALGANIFNMGIAGAAGGFAVYRLLSRVLPGLRGQVAAVAFAGWASTVIAAICCAGQLAWSGTTSWAPAFSAMAGIHMIIGLGEGLISALVFVGVRHTRPELALASPAPGQPAAVSGWWLVYAGLAVLGLVLFAAPFASPLPDGLEAVAAKLGFEHAAHDPVLPAPAADYAVPGVHWAAGATALAGAIGAVVVFLLAWLLARWLVRERPAPSPPVPS
jgi:cobalt/nickel transport system permease protein